MTDDTPMNDASGHDQELRALAARLGVAAADRVDVERTARAVVDRLRDPAVFPLRPGRRALPVWLRAAAAAVVLLGGAFVARQTLAPAGRDQPLVAEDLRGLTATELTELLNGLDQVLDSAVTAVGSELEELTESQLEAVLGSLEG